MNATPRSGEYMLQSFGHNMILEQLLRKNISGQHDIGEFVNIVIKNVQN